MKAIIGIIMVILQLLSDLGSKKTGGRVFFQNIYNFPSFVGELAFFIGSSFCGIIGIILFILQVKSDTEKEKKKKENTENYDSPKSNNDDNNRSLH